MTLLVVGAIFAFAVRRELPGIDIQTVGVILMLAGAAVIVHARRGRVREAGTTRVEEADDQGQGPDRVVRESSTERYRG